MYGIVKSAIFLGYKSRRKDQVIIVIRINLDFFSHSQKLLGGTRVDGDYLFYNIFNLQEQKVEIHTKHIESNYSHNNIP